MRAHSTFGQCRAPCSPVVASPAFPSPPSVSLFPPVWWRRWGVGGRFLAGANPIVTSQYLPPSHSHAATTRRPPLPPSRRALGYGLRSPGLEIWKCSACDYRRTAQGTMSDGCRAVRKQPFPHHARRSESRRTLSPVLSECGVSTHSISPGTAAEATAQRAA